MKKIVEFLVYCSVCVPAVVFMCFLASLHADRYDPKTFEEKYIIKEMEREPVDVEIVFEEDLVVVEEERTKKKSLGEFKLTAYCSCEKCCGEWALNRPKDENGNDIVVGASGERLYQGKSVAVDPSVIPYGSVLYIDGKEYVAHDCGGAIKGNRIDVYFNNHSDALNFGVQYANVEVEKK